MYQVYWQMYLSQYVNALLRIYMHWDDLFRIETDSQKGAFVMLDEDYFQALQRQRSVSAHHCIFLFQG